MRKNTLLIAVAAAALAVGSGTAFAQAPQGGQRSESPAAQSNPASRNAPAEKVQGAEPKGSTSQRMGQEQKSPGSKSTTGQAPSDQKSGQANERRNEKMGQEHKGNRSTTGQAPSQQQQTTPRSDRMNNANERNERANEPSRTNERGANENRAGASTSTSGSVNLTSEQRTKIHSIIVSEHSAPRIAHADFDVHVGTVVPRGKVKFAPLPSTIVEIEPRWRGFEYFLVGEEIVVVDPATLRIVAVLPA